MNNTVRNTLILSAVTTVVIVVIGVLASLWLRGDGIHTAANESVVRTLALDFGARLKEVPLSGKPDITKQVIGQSYGPYVTPELLEAWVSDPSKAPGRETSSPWPERIEIVSIAPQGEGYIVQGEVILMTSKEVAEGGNAGTIPFVIQTVKRDGIWRIAAYEEQTQS